MNFKINMNGDDRETLSRELFAVWEASNSLIARMQEMTLNGRNYPGNPEGLREDQDKRRELAMRVQEIMRWAETGIMEIQNE